MDSWIIVLLAVALTGFALWAYFTAQRLNVLHIRTDAALASLQAALDRRAAVVAALLAEEPTAQPRAQVVTQTAEATALEPVDFGGRGEQETKINSLIADFLQSRPVQLVDAEVRVQLAQRFYNEAVADTRALRLRPLVRVFHLGGTARLPQFCDYSLVSVEPHET